MGLKIKSFIPYEDNRTLKEELYLFKENYDLLLNNFTEILSCGNMFHCKLSFAYISTVYFGGGYIPLGVLLIGWEEGILKSFCPECGEKQLWIFSFGGGLTFGWEQGLCINCKKILKVKSDVSEYFSLYKELVPIIKMFPTNTVVEVEKVIPEFSWKYGLVFKKCKVKEKVEFYKPLKFKEVVEILKTGEFKSSKEIVITFKETEDFINFLLKNKSW